MPAGVQGVTVELLHLYTGGSPLSRAADPGAARLGRATAVLPFTGDWTVDRARARRHVHRGTRQLRHHHRALTVRAATRTERRGQSVGAVGYPWWMTGVRTRRPFPYLASVLACYTLGHELSFLASFGADFDRGLTSTGHGSLWTMSVAVVAALGVPLLAGVHRILVLSRQVGALSMVRHHASRRSTTASAPLVASSCDSGCSSLAPALLLFILSENVEHLASGLVAPGLGVFEGDVYGWAPMAFLVASFDRRRAGTLPVATRRPRQRGSQVASRPTLSRPSQRRPVPTDWRVPGSHDVGSSFRTSPASERLLHSLTLSSATRVDAGVRARASSPGSHA